MGRGTAGLAVLSTLLCMAPMAASAGAVPIVSTGPAPSLPAYSGAPAEPKPIRDKTRPPQNPHLAPNPKSNIHNDTWMTDAYLGAGPLGSSPVVQSEAMPGALCGTLAFTSDGKIAAVCPSIANPPQARLIDPETLRILSSYDLPNAPDPPGTVPFQNFSGGGYFFLDGRDRIWVSTKTDHLYVLSTEGGALALERDIDLTSVLDPATERISSALPDFEGRIWFVSKQNGKVGTYDRRTGAIKVMRLGEQIQNSFAVGQGGVFIASNRRMYRFKAARNGAPRIVWQKRYDNNRTVKPGQADDGTGTTPTIMKGGYVAITDNADPIQVVVMRTAAKLSRGQKRVVCEVPVFRRGASATENSLMTAGRSLVVENNYGYSNPFAPGGPNLSEPGFARVDVKPNGKGCRKVWTNHEVRAPTVVPKLSQKNGLIYAYTRPYDPSGAVGYYWTTIDFHTGRTVFSQYAGSGLTFNNNYAGLALGPDGDAYLGTIGGLVKLSDGS